MIILTKKQGKTVPVWEKLYNESNNAIGVFKSVEDKLTKINDEALQALNDIEKEIERQETYKNSLKMTIENNEEVLSNIKKLLNDY